MRVALITHNVIKNDGQGRVNFELASHLVRNGHSVHLFAHRVDPGLARIPGITVHHVPALKLTNLLKGISFAIFLWIRIRGQKFDIVHNNGDAGFVASDVNTCHYCHSGSPKTAVTAGRARALRTAYRWIHRSFHARMERSVYARSTRVIAVSGMVRDELVQNAEVEGSRVRVIPNGVDSREFRPGRHSSTPGDPVRLLFVGDLRTPRKGIETLLQAFSLLKSPATLTIVGDASHSPYPAVVNRMDSALRARIHFLGFRRDVPEIFAQHDIFVFPSLYDPCPLVTLEAMACGLPIIVSSRTGTADMIEQGRNGYVLADPTEHPKLAALIDTLAADPQLRVAMGQAARVTAETHSWLHMARHYETTYQELASLRT